MKWLLKNIAFHSLALYVTSLLFSGLVIVGGLQSVIAGGILFTFISAIGRPILKVVSLPLTILTLGLFSFFINTILLFLLTVFYAKISVHPFVTSRFSLIGIVIAPFHLNVFFAFVVVSFAISGIISFLSWITNN